VARKKMILKYKSVGQERFINLIRFLSYSDGNSKNELWIKDVLCPEWTPGIEGVVMEDGEGWNCLSPFAKLISSKHSYDNVGDMTWEVVIEIPDQATVSTVPVGEDFKDAKGGELYPVLANRLLILINNIVNGKD